MSTARGRLSLGSIDQYRVACRTRSNKQPYLSHLAHLTAALYSRSTSLTRRTVQRVCWSPRCPGSICVNYISILDTTYPRQALQYVGIARGTSFFYRPRYFVGLLFDLERALTSAVGGLCQSVFSQHAERYLPGAVADCKNSQDQHARKIGF